MKQMRPLVTLSSVLLACWITGANATEAGMEFSYHRPDFKEAPEDVPKSARAGDLELPGGVKVPLYSLSIASGRMDGLETFSPRSFKLDREIKPEIAAQLDAYAYPQGIIFVPKNWSIRSGSAGADGSMVLLFAPDKSGKIYLSYSSAGACVGCAYSDGSLYFDEARKLAKGDEFSFYRKSDLVRSVRLNQFEKGYSIKIAEGNPVDGIAYFDESSDLPFFDARISLPSAQHSLATAVLNQFKRP